MTLLAQGCPCGGWPPWTITDVAETSDLLVGRSAKEVIPADDEAQRPRCFHTIFKEEALAAAGAAEDAAAAAVEKGIGVLVLEANLRVLAAQTAVTEGIPLLVNSMLDRTSS